MGPNGLDKLGGTNDRRIELYSEAYEARINPGSRLQIPDTSFGGPSAGKSTVDSGADGWRRLENLLRSAGQIFDKDIKGRWGRYSRGEKAERQGARSIEIDSKATPAPARESPIDPSASANQKLEAAYGYAADFEERQRDAAAFFGGGRRW
jgi:hypothetical protein